MSTVSAEMVRLHARELKMPSVVRGFEEVARQAREAGWAHEEFLAELLAQEVQSRRDSAVRQRVREAHFPELKPLDTFDLTLAEGIEPDIVRELARGAWVGEARNVLLAGPIGTGKTHLAIALGIEAARQRLRVLFVRAADLVRQLIEARDGRELGRMQRRLQRVDLLIVDEVGFVPFDRQGGELLFNVIAERYENKSVLVTTNLAFSEWPKVLGGDEKLTTALLDRLADRATVITTKGKSFRMRRRAARGEAQPVSQRAGQPKESRA